MSFNPKALSEYPFEEIRQSYTQKDAILYALGLGLGADPLNSVELDYLLETRLKVLPTLSVTLATPGMWIKDPALGVTFTKLVHSAQKTIFHTPLKPAANVKAIPKVSALYDRGEGRGAICVVERDIVDCDDDTHFSTIKQTLLLRADGGFGGPPPPKIDKITMPERPADFEHSYPTSARTALIYRLCGDWNPLHVDPDVATKAGFAKPILHGLASYGIAGWVLRQTDNTDLADLACRFCGVVYPGDWFDFKIWDETDHYRFEAYVGNKRVLDQGIAYK